MQRLLLYGILMIYLTILNHHSLCAQSFIGIETGYTRNWLSTDISDRSFTRIVSGPGYGISLPIRFDVKSSFGLQICPELFAKNYSIERTDSFEGIFESFHNSYLQLPVLARFTAGIKPVKYFVSGGVYAGYWISGKVTGVIPNILNIADSVNANGQVTEYLKFTPYSEKYKFDLRKDRRFEWGLIADAGISYSLKNWYELFIEGRYYYSLSDQQKKYMINQVRRYNHSLFISAGFMIPFIKK